MGSVYPLALRRPIYWSDTSFSRHPLPFSQRVDVSPSFDSSGGRAKLPAELPPTSMSSIPLTVVHRRRQCYQPEREYSLGYRLHVHLIGGRIIAAQRRVERHRPLFPV